MGAGAELDFRSPPGELPDASVSNAELAPMAAGTVKGRQIDAGTGAPVDLTGAEQAENFRRATVQTVTGLSGDITIAINNDTTVVLIESTADIRVQAVSGTFEQGREIVFEHVRTSGTGVLQFQHQSAVGGGAVDFLLPGNVPYFLGHRGSLTLRTRTTFLRFQTASDQVRPENTAAPNAAGDSVHVVKRVVCASGGAAGTADDVTIWNANAPFALRILDATLRVSTAVVGSSAALRTASGGGGSVVLPDPGAATQTFSTATTGPHDDVAVATATVAANGSLFLRRSDRSAVGELILTYIRT